MIEDDDDEKKDDDNDDKEEEEFSEQEYFVGFCTETNMAWRMLPDKGALCWPPVTVSWWSLQCFWPEIFHLSHPSVSHFMTDFFGGAAAAAAFSGAAETSRSAFTVSRKTRAHCWASMVLDARKLVSWVSPSPCSS